MKAPVQTLDTNDITSEVFTIAPSQIQYIAQVFGNNIANEMNMRPLANKFRELAEKSLRAALSAARHMGDVR